MHFQHDFLNFAKVSRNLNKMFAFKEGGGYSRGEAPRGPADLDRRRGALPVLRVHDPPRALARPQRARGMFGEILRKYNRNRCNIR